MRNFSKKQDSSFQNLNLVGYEATLAVLERRLWRERTEPAHL